MARNPTRDLSALAAIVIERGASGIESELLLERQRERSKLLDRAAKVISRKRRTFRQLVRRGIIDYRKLPHPLSKRDIEIGQTREKEVAEQRRREESESDDINF